MLRSRVAQLRHLPANNNTYDINCSICHGEYTDPIIINCHHSFCKKCLDTWMRHNLLQMKEDGLFGFKRVFPCPYCKAETQVPTGGINGFPKSFHVEQLKEMNIKLTAKIQYPKCQKHQAEELKFFCTKCDSIICLNCKILDHEGHKAEMIDMVAAGKRLRLQEQVQQVEMDLEQLKSIEASCTTEKETVSDNKKLALTHLRQQADDIKKKIDKRVMKLEKEITAKFEVYERNIDKELSDVEESREKLSTFSKNANSAISASSDHDVINNYDKLLNSRKNISIGESRWPIADYQSTLDKIYCPGKISLQELESMVGTVSTPSYPLSDVKKSREKLSTFSKNANSEIASSDDDESRHFFRDLSSGEISPIDDIDCSKELEAYGSYMSSFLRCQEKQGKTVMF